MRIYSSDNIFKNINTTDEEESQFQEFLTSLDTSPASLRAIKSDIRKFADWFVAVNRERFDSSRITTTDISSFKTYLRSDQQQAVSTVNRCIVHLRKYLKYLCTQNYINDNPATRVKELRRQQLAPKGLDRSQVRKILREAELRNDFRSAAIFNLILFTGARVSDVINLEIRDLMITQRAGSVVFRHRKGNKQTTSPLPQKARQAILKYLEFRPDVESDPIFIGERGPISSRCVRKICDKYSALCGFKFYPHLLRHTMAHRYLKDTGNDLVGLAAILGHENINTTAIYTRRSESELQEAAERMNY